MRSSRTRPHLRTVLCCSVGASCLIALLTTNPSVNAQRRRDFTRAERQALRDGQLVRRPETRMESGERWVGGSSWQRVNAPIAQVWDAIRQPNNYRHLIPGVDRVRVVEEGTNQQIVYLRHTYAFVSASYYAQIRTDERRRAIRFELDRSRPHDVRGGRGLLTLRRHRNSQTTVIWSVMANPGNGILVGLLGSVLNDWLLRVPWCVRGFFQPESPHC